MRIKLQNKCLIPLIPFLQGMKLKGEQSRARSKFLALAMEAYAALHESELELLGEYAVPDENGEPKITADGGFTLKDGNTGEYLAEREKLFNEVAEIEGGTYTAHLSLMKRVLTEYGEDLDGENAALYDALCDAFEEAAKAPPENGGDGNAGK
jgi:hypothetical protein